MAEGAGILYKLEWAWHVWAEADFCKKLAAGASDLRSLAPPSQQRKPQITLPEQSIIKLYGC